MKILFLNQFFWPDASATSQLLGDVTSHLTASGRPVSVICGSASYESSTPQTPPDVEIIRLRTSAFSRSRFGRVGSYLSFLAGALWQGFQVSSPDVVVTLTTPPLLSLVGLAIQKLRGASHVIWEMDVYPDVAIDLGVIANGSIAARVFGWLADLPRKQADRVIVLGECMKTRLLAHGIPEEKIFIAENWADSDDVQEGSVLDSLPAAPAPLSILYSGNFGLAHDAVTVSHALRALHTDNQAAPRIQFTFAGGGSRYSWLRNLCEEEKLTNAAFLPYCERHELGARLASGHIGLVAQKTECLGSAVPSKTYGIMAAGRPILFIGPRTATPARIIERYKCGWQVECGDVEGLTTLLRELDSDRERITEAGERAHRAFVDHYQRSIGVARIARIIGSKSEVKTGARAHAAVG